jgi:hypothetical protein
VNELSFEYWLDPQSACSRVSTIDTLDPLLPILVNFDTCTNKARLHDARCGTHRCSSALPLRSLVCLRPCSAARRAYTAATMRLGWSGHGARAPRRPRRSRPCRRCWTAACPSRAPRRTARRATGRLPTPARARASARTTRRRRPRSAAHPAARHLGPQTAAGRSPAPGAPARRWQPSCAPSPPRPA